jgi:hypothetical protein
MIAHVLWSHHDRGGQRGVAVTLAILDAPVFAGPLPEMVAATATRAWHRANPTHPGANAGRAARRRLRHGMAIESIDDGECEGALSWPVVNPRRGRTTPHRSALPG